YLLNALYFTGENLRATSTISLSPVISYLTAVLFDLGLKSEIAILIVTGVFAVIGNLGFFLLLKTRFNNILSLLGSIIFITFSLNLLWLANGSIDIPAVGLTCWMMYFLILALNKNSKYFILTFITFIIAFFIRPTVILIVPVAILYYLSKKDFINNLFNKNRFLKLKNYIFSYEFLFIVIGILLGIAIAFFILRKVTIMGNNLTFLSQATDAIAGSKGSSIDNAYNTNPFFYLENFPNFLSSSKTLFLDKKPFLANPTLIAYGFILVLLSGVILFLSKSYNILKNHKKALITIIALSLITIFTFTQFSSFITIILTFLILLISDFFLKKYGIDKTGLNITFISWILVYLIFFSYMDIKVDRYIITALPALTYFIISSISLIQDKFPKKEKLFKNSYYVIILFFIVSSFAFTFTIGETNQFREPEEMAKFLMDYDPDYKDKFISVYNMRPFLWYFQKDVGAIYSNNASQIDKSNSTYYISNIKQNNLTNYTEIKNIGNLYLYEKINY
ncbi:glycosyltransferase family 39 protein, partial [Methanobrevibacter sp. OttesenSCG-928-K11]|nr:glycosyltransferase family 39 protein [Methanobrevibacter sp. OttesenSCG-928-K11]